MFKCYRLFLPGFVVAALLMLTWGPAQAYVDLSTFTEAGPDTGGRWTVSGSANEIVTQELNPNYPTFFISPNDYINVLITGKMKVASSGDTDFIGFSFGHRAPLTVSNTDFDLYLLDWKKSQETSGSYTAYVGLTLSRINGAITLSSSERDKYFLGHTPSAGNPLFQVLGSDTGTGKGWASLTEYDFTLLYTPTRIKIDLAGGSGYFAGGKTIFDLTGTFQAGRFGFYDFSQQVGQFYNLQITNLAPLPGALWLLGSGLVGLLGWRRFNRD